MVEIDQDQNLDQAQDQKIQVTETKILGINLLINHFNYYFF